MQRIASFESYMTGGTPLRVHAILGSRSAMLVDTAMRGHEGMVSRALDFLRKQGIPLAWIANTHAHHDHMGLNFWVQEQTGARVVSHAWSRRWIADPAKNFQEFVLAFPELISDTPAVRQEIFDTMGPGTKLDLGLVGGEHFYLGDTEVEIVDTSGHLPGEIGLLIHEDQTLVLGDVLVGLDLPMFHGYVDPYRYRQSLGRIRQLILMGRVTRVITSHLSEFGGPEDILKAIGDRERSMDEIRTIICDSLRKKPGTLRDVWLLVSKRKQKRPEFRGLAMVAGHLAELMGHEEVSYHQGLYQVN